MELFYLTRQQFLAVPLFNVSDLTTKKEITCTVLDIPIKILHFSLETIFESFT